MLQANSADPDQTPHSETSAFLPMYHLKDAMLIWVNKSSVMDLNLNQNGR